MFFPVRARAQGSLCVFSQPKVAPPVAQLGDLREFPFRLLKAKVALPASPLRSQEVFSIDWQFRTRNTCFLHLEKSTKYLDGCNAFWRFRSARPALQKSTNASRRCLPPVARRLFWPKVGAKRSPHHTLHRRSEPKSQEIVTRLVKYRYFCIGKAASH